MTKIFRKLWARGFGKLGRFYCRYTWLEEALQLLPYGTTGIDHILRKSACRYDLMEHLTDGEESLNRLSGIDQRIISAVRSMKHPLNLDDRRTCYRDVLAGASKRESFLVDTALELLNTNSVVPQYGTPAIDVKVSDDCRRVDFTSSNASLTVHDATLMWDCNCRDPYPPGYKRNPCPIHSQPGADAISHAFSHGLVRITYDGVSVFWRDMQDLWPPSIDAFHMVRHLNEDGYPYLQARHLCDLGCGTGFLGIWACAKNQAHRHVTFADWLLSPLLLTHGNFAHRRPGVNATAHYKLGLHDDWVNDEAIASPRKSDVLLCNPPYLPVIAGFEDILYDSTVAGTDLLEYVIAHSETLADRVFVSYSSVAEKEVRLILQRCHKSLRLVGNVETVPFRVGHAFNKRGYTNALHDSGRLNFHKDDVHPFWHTVATYEVITNSAMRF